MVSAFKGPDDSAQRKALAQQQAAIEKKEQLLAEQLQSKRKVLASGKSMTLFDSLLGVNESDPNKRKTLGK